MQKKKIDPEIYMQYTSFRMLFILIALRAFETILELLHLSEMSMDAALGKLCSVEFYVPRRCTLYVPIVQQ